MFSRYADPHNLCDIFANVKQVFVANPNKSYEVQKMLIMNRDRLLRFLPDFLSERTDDNQFLDEKAFLIKQIRALPSRPVAPNPAT